MYIPKKYFTKQLPPKTVHRGVMQLCEKTGSPVKTPFFVEVQTAPHSQINDCYLNVINYTREHDGQIVHGWSISEVPGIFIEAQFHAIWMSPSGDYVDISPSPDEETKILFLPDPSKEFKEKEFNRFENIRIPLINHPVVTRFLEHCEKYHRYLDSCLVKEDPSRVIYDVAKKDQLDEEMAILTIAIHNLPCGRNDLCRCGSGIKYKRCCGK